MIVFINTLSLSFEYERVDREGIFLYTHSSLRHLWELLLEYTFIFIIVLTAPKLMYVCNGEVEKESVVYQHAHNRIERDLDSLSLRSQIFIKVHLFTSTQQANYDLLLCCCFSMTFRCTRKMPSYKSFVGFSGLLLQPHP